MKQRYKDPSAPSTATPEIAEACGSRRVRYRVTAHQPPAAESIAGSTAASVFEAARAALLPEGYPGSVRPEYLRFQVYDTIQAACSYLRAILSTGAILKASGVGEAAASPMAAAVAWVLRDGFGMCGSLLFASLVGVGFDENVKEWRLFADLINDVGLTLNMLAPMAGERFFLVAALGSTCTSICGMVAGATRASITAHFALSGSQKAPLRGSAVHTLRVRRCE